MRFSIVATALVASLVGFGSSMAIVVEAARHLGATQAQTTSWVMSLCLGMGVTSAYLSLRFRMPILTAWSLAGALLISATPDGTTMGHAIAAFMFAAMLAILAGIVPALGALIARLPASIAGGMLAGLLLRFALALFTGAQTAPALVLPLVAIFVLARLLHPASAALIVIVVALPLAWLEGYPLPGMSLTLSGLVWMPPEWSLATLVSLGIPMFLVSMATQQISGVAVLRLAGYTPPAGTCFAVTGLATLLMAPVGAYSINLSSVTASICTGPDTHPDPAKRYLVGPVFAVIYGAIGLASASLTTAIAELPPVIVATIAGTALIGPLANALSSAMYQERERFAAVLAFLITASNITFLGVGGAFWGLLAGVVVLWLDRVALSSRR